MKKLLLSIMAITSISTALWMNISSCHKENKVQEDTSHRVSPKTQVTPEFNSSLAFAQIAKQVEFGSRVPNTKAHDACKEYLISELTQYADTVLTQSFVSLTYGTKWKLTNIVGQFNPENQNRILLCAHWDSRPRSDEDKNPANVNKGIPGANDGASGVGILLEIARILHSAKQPIGIDIVFFDGEDIGLSHDADNFCLGSKYFAENFPLPIRPRYAILLDLVGDKEAQFTIESTSYQSAPLVVERIWQLGSIYGNGLFVKQEGGGITDDHIQLIKNGIPAIDIIDIGLVGNSSTNPRRQYWHTQGDTMDVIGEATLNAVGTVLIKHLYTNPLVM